MSIVASGTATIPVQHDGAERVIAAEYGLEYGQRTRHYPGHEEIVLDRVTWDDTGEDVPPDVFSDHEHKITERCMSNARSR